MEQFIVICQQVIGSLDTGYSIHYGWDGEKFKTRKAAISHGFKIRDSDDFNIGVLRRGHLAQFCWMEEVCDDDLDEVAEHIGLGVCRR